MDLQSANSAVEFDASFRTEDYAALTLQMADRRDIKRWRFLQVAMLVFIVPVAAVATLAFLWVVDSQRVPFSDAILFLPKLLWDELLIPWLLFCAFAILEMLRYRSNIRARVGRLAGGVNLTFETNHFRIDDRGVEVTRPYVISRYEWPAIRSVEETDNHLFLRNHQLAAIIIPKRDLTSETVESVKMRISAHVQESPRS